jgi:hypothetical protein
MVLHMEEFEVLIGTWTTESKHRLVDEIVTGGSTFEWLEGRQFVLQRSFANHDQFPDGLWVFGPPASGEGLVAEYFDSRGVRRTFDCSLVDGVLRLWRDDADFGQRLSAELAPDRFVGLAEIAETPGEWVEDMRTTYRRVGG